VSEALRFSVLKEYTQTDKIKINLDRRKSIDYYNKGVAEDKIILSRPIIALHYLSGATSFGLILGIFMIIFMDPRIYGILISLTSVYVRYQVWKYLKNRALQYTYQQALTSEEIFRELYQDKTFTLKNMQTGKIVRHPEKWSMVLPKKSEVQQEG
jgi:hypothetical protein